MTILSEYSFLLIPKCNLFLNLLLFFFLLIRYRVYLKWITYYSFKNNCFVYCASKTNQISIILMRNTKYILVYYVCTLCNKTTYVLL